MSQGILLKVTALEPPCFYTENENGVFYSSDLSLSKVPPAYVSHSANFHPIQLRRDRKDDTSLLIHLCDWPTPLEGSWEMVSLQKYKIEEKNPTT